MLQKYKNILIHINIFQEVYNMEKNKMLIQEMNYRYILDYLYSQYSLVLLGDYNKDNYKIMELLGFLGYFEKMYMPCKETYIADDFYYIMQKMGCSDNSKYLAIGRNTNMELDAAKRCYIHTCKLVEDYDFNDNEPTYRISAVEKIKKIL